MKFNQYSQIVELILTIAVLILSFSFFPILYDESYDAFCNMQVAGQFSDFSLMDQYYLAWVGFDEIYKFLHNNWPAINWTGIAFIFFNLLGLFLVLVSLKRILRLTKVPAYLILVFQLVLSLVYIDNIVSITHTRFSILFCGLSILNFGLITNMSKKEHFIYLLLFIVGVLHRPESGIGLFALMGAALIILRFYQLFNHASRFVLPAVFMIILYGSFVFDWYKTDLFERKLEPNIEYALTTKRILPLEAMTNAEDSLRYEMATQGLFIDEDFLSIDFLRKLAAVEADFDFDKYTESVYKLLNWYVYYPYFPFLLIMLIIMGVISRAGFVFWIKFTLLNGLFFLFMSYISYGTNIAPRHVSGLLLLNTIAVTFLFFKEVGAGGISKRWHLGLGLVWLFVALFTLQNYQYRYELVQEEVRCYNQAMDKFEENYSDKYVVVTLLNYHLFDQEFKFFNELRNGNTYLMYDILYYSKVPPYNTYLSKLCNCNPKDPIAFFTWLKEEGALYLLAERRQDLTQRYLNQYKGSSLILVQDISFPDPVCFQNFGGLDLNVTRFQ